LESGGGVCGDTASEGIVVSWRGLRTRFARRCPDTELARAALHFLDGAVCGTHRSVGRAAAVELRDANPAPLNELSPYGNIQPPHLHGTFVSKQGQFLMTALPGGERGSKDDVYKHTMWPAAYCFVADYIIHKIHLRVLEHIERQRRKMRR